MNIRNIGAIAAAATLIFAGSTYANGGRGGGLHLQNLSGPRPVVAEKAPASMGECCKSKVTLVSERDNRGRVVRAVPTSTHGCPSCKTTTTLLGHGKAKVEKSLHTCAANQTLACCAK